MSKVRKLRSLVKQRLTAAAEDIFVLFERTIAEYEEELCRSKEENERHRKLLDAVFKPQLRLHRAALPSDVKEEQQQERSPRLDQEEPAEPPHIKEEPEEVWSRQEGEQLQGLEDPDLTKFPFPPVPVKSEEDEEKPQSSQLHQRLTEQMETGADGEDCGGPGPASSSDPDPHLEPDTEDKMSESFKSDDSVDSDFWKETRERPSGLNSLKDDGTSESAGCDGGKKVSSCSDDKTSECVEPESDDSVDSDFWKDDRKAQESGRKPYSCSECGKGKREFLCSVCGQKCLYESHLKIHMRTHTGEKPFICPVCGKKYAHKASMQSHMVVHSVEKQYTCSACDKGFAWYTELKYHQCVAESSHQPPYCTETL